ncbi:MAG: DNA translocase FtsK 4TM domain-containing protein, partial [Kiritimatiellae bacterium]|nr:DNA translocase FtsK 4TM domain-containing protein [Kiritimatiellia bacterium]
MSEVPSRSKRKIEAPDSRLRLLGFLLLPLTDFPLLSLISYDYRDIGALNAPPNDPPNNLIGIAGAWSTYPGYMLFGLGVWLLPAWMALLCLLMASGHTSRPGA